MAVRKKFKGESFEALLRRFKKNVEKRDVINEVKRREHFIKPSVKRRQQINRAKYIQHIKDAQNLI